MSIKKGFKVDQRVGIAIDALSADQKAALEPLLESRRRFVNHSNLPGMTQELSGSKPLYATNAGLDMRVIFTIRDDNIIVLDIMRKATMDRLRKKKKATVRKKLSPTSAR